MVSCLEFLTSVNHLNVPNLLSFYETNINTTYVASALANLHVTIGALAILTAECDHMLKCMIFSSAVNEMFFLMNSLMSLFVFVLYFRLVEKR